MHPSVAPQPENQPRQTEVPSRKVTFYHGSGFDFDGFDLDESNTGEAAAYLTSDYSLAAQYAEGIWGPNETPVLYEVTVSLPDDTPTLEARDEFGEPKGLNDLQDEAKATGKPAVYIPDTFNEGSGQLELVVFDPSILEITRKNYL